MSSVLKNGMSQDKNPKQGKKPTRQPQEEYHDVATLAGILVHSSETLAKTENKKFQESKLMY